jgi:uncharacterized protein YndB with AHSA1/START domain
VSHEHSDQSQPYVHRELRIEARPEIVFQYFVDPDRIARWAGPVLVADARPGGAFQTILEGKHSGSGRFVEIDPPRRIVYTWGWDEPNHPIPPGSTRVEVDLTPDRGGTLLRLRHFGLPADAVDDHTEGWTYFLGKLATVVAGGGPGASQMAARPASAPAALEA